MYPITTWQARKAAALSAVDEAILTKRRAERAGRKTQREWLTARGLKATRAQHVYRVETTAIDIPAWASQHAIPGFTSEACVIWVRERGVAKTIARYDTEAGGRPEIQKVEARRCCYCGLWHLGFNAAELREREQRVRLSLGTLELGPCSVHCSWRAESNGIGVKRKQS
jgi:hypothetical protein